MNFLKRAMTSISRKPGKTVILLLLVFVLGSIIAGAIATSGAINNTEANLRRNMRPIVSLEMDWQTIEEIAIETDEWTQPEQITADLIREIGALPYVSHFDYSIRTSLTSFELERYEPSDGSIHWGAENEPTWLDFIGVSRPELIYVEEGIIELVDGRMFTETDVNDLPPHQSVVIVSRDFLETNQLSIGQVITLNNIVRNDINWESNEFWSDENIFAQEEYTFEIIGAFDLVSSEVAPNEDDWETEHRVREQSNWLFVPNAVTESASRFMHEKAIAMAAEAGTLEDLPDGSKDFQYLVDNVFVLDNPLEIENFREAAEPLLPEFWTVTDLSNTFAEISSSMETLQGIAGSILWVAIGTTILILSLLITLFLRDRRHEMGIYLALGEKKSSIISQILLEVGSVAIIGITLAVFMGNIVSSGMSRTMLRNELTQQEDALWGGSITVSVGGSMANMGFGQEMTPEEMLEAFDVSLNVQTILVFYGIGLGTIVVSTLIPVIYIVRLDPKKVLM